MKDWTPCDEVPEMERKNYRNGEERKTIEEFLESDADVVKRDFAGEYNSKNLNNVAMKYRNAVKALNAKVKVSKRGTCLYLSREK